MTDGFAYVGAVDNWMDFRDMILKGFEECESELQFNNLLMGLASCLHPTTDSLDLTRKALGMKLLTKKEKDTLNKTIYKK